MTLQGSVQKAPKGLIGFDHSSASLTSDQANQYAAQGYKFCIRYLSRTAASRVANEQQGRPDLSADEAQNILSAGMALLAVQHVALSGWIPTPALGDDYGQAAAQYAAEAGLLPGTNVFLDLEDIPQETAKSDIISYANNWYDAVLNAGFEPGAYIGFNVWLTPQELFFNLKFKHYWRAPGDITDVFHRGYQLLQHEDESGFDRNVTQDDAYGDGIYWHTLNPDLIS